MNFQNKLLRAYISSDLMELHNVFHRGYHPNPRFVLEQYPEFKQFRFHIYTDDFYTFTGIYFEIKSMTIIHETLYSKSDEDF